MYGLGSTKCIGLDNAVIMNMHTKSCGFRILGTETSGFRLAVRGFGSAFAGAEGKGG